ncbi:MAG TPA: hypothetical protein VIL48_17810 [Acidimicrobiales bacterium]|jgi:hypothetical protein
MEAPPAHQASQSIDPTPTDWPRRVLHVLGTGVSVALPGFDLRTVLPHPTAFDQPIRSLEATAATFETMGGSLGDVLYDVRWDCADATRFTNQFAFDRAPQLTARATDLRELADQLRRIQARTRDEIDWIRAIAREVTSFLDRIDAAYLRAKAAAAEAVADAERALGQLRSAAEGAFGGAIDLARAGVDELTGGDGRDELSRALSQARGALGDARRAFASIVDFTTGWEFNRTNLPEGDCRAWYDVDDFMSWKSGSAEAYGVTYLARGPFRGVGR